MTNRLGDSNPTSSCIVRVCPAMSSSTAGGATSKGQDNGYGRRRAGGGHTHWQRAWPKCGRRPNGRRWRD
jgi:hypothetical protein